MQIPCTVPGCTGGVRVGLQESEANFQPGRFGKAHGSVWAAKFIWKQKIKLLRFLRCLSKSRYFFAVFQDLCLLFPCVILQALTVVTTSYI